MNIKERNSVLLKCGESEREIYRERRRTKRRLQERWTKIIQGTRREREQKKKRRNADDRENDKDRDKH